MLYSYHLRTAGSADVESAFGSAFPEDGVVVFAFGNH